MDDLKNENDVAEEPQDDKKEEVLNNKNENENDNVEQPKDNLDKKPEEQTQDAAQIEEIFEKKIDSLNKKIDNLQSIISNLSLQSGAAIHEDDIDLSDEESFKSNCQIEAIEDLNLN